MKIKATFKGRYECAPVTLGALGLVGESILQFIDGEIIEVDDNIADSLINEKLATSEVEDADNDLHE